MNDINISPRAAVYSNKAAVDKAVYKAIAVYKSDVSAVYSNKTTAVYKSDVSAVYSNKAAVDKADVSADYKSYNKSKLAKRETDADVAYYNFQKTRDPLANKYPNKPNNKQANVKVPMKLLLLIQEFIKKRTDWKKLNWKKLTKGTSYYQGDLLKTLLLMGKYPYSKPSHVRRIFAVIKEEIKGFSEAKIAEALCVVIDRMRIDYLTLQLKPFVNTKPDEKVISLWDKISENVHV